MTAVKIFSENSKIQFTQKDYRRLFLLGALFGAIIFILIYGIKILDPTYTGWIYYGDYDLKQHFAGWSHYKNSSWQFPIGLIETLSYPISMSVIYTDSIPIVSLFFKLFSPLLPVDFQFFGIVGILFFALSGGTSVILLKRFINNPWVCLAFSPLFVVSFPMIQRMFYHTALAAQWLILFALIIWVYDTFPEKSYKSELMWALMGFLCVGIHSYFLVMIGIIMLADRVTFFVAHKGKILKAILPMIAFCIAGLITLWVLGGFYGESSGVSEGLGTFGANFNTFINPIDYGKILPNLGVENIFQYEGCGYLGFGVILLSLFVDIMLILKRKSMDKHLFADTVKASDEDAKTVPEKIYLQIGFVLFVLSFLIATLPKISIGKLSIVQIPYPGPIYKLANVFRSNGRFIWVGMYLLMLAIVVLADRFLESKRIALILVIAAVLIIQTIDLWDMISERREYYSENHTYSTIWDDNPELNKMVEDKKAFVFLYAGSELNMETAFYAYKHGMNLNNFYFARDIDEEVGKVINAYIDEIYNGLVRDDTVYIMKMDDYEAIKDNIAGLDVDIVFVDGYAIFGR